MQLSCSFCHPSRNIGRSNCLGCGRCIAFAREPDPALSRELDEMAAARLRGPTLKESQGDVDRRVLEHSERILKPLSDFTHDQIAASSGINVCAVKHSLMRLSKTGAILAAGYIVLSRGRRRNVWQLVPPQLRGQISEAPVGRRQELEPKRRRRRVQAAEPVSAPEAASEVANVGELVLV